MGGGGVRPRGHSELLSRFHQVSQGENNLGCINFGLFSGSSRSSDMIVKSYKLRELMLKITMTSSSIQRRLQLAKFGKNCRGVPNEREEWSSGYNLYIYHSATGKILKMETSVLLKSKKMWWIYRSFSPCNYIRHTYVIYGEFNFQKNIIPNPIAFLETKFCILFFYCFNCYSYCITAFLKHVLECRT